MGLFNGRVGVAWAGFGLMGALCVTACGSSSDSGSSGGSADFTALQKAYANPTGTLSAGDKAAIIAGLDNANASMSGSVGLLSARVGGVKLPPGAHVLDDNPISCPTPTDSSGIKCTCSGGGSVSVSASASQNGENISESESYSNCTITEADATATLNGTVKVSISTNPEMEIFSGKLTETITPPGETVSIDMEYALVNDEISYNVEVADGNVLIQATGSWDSTTHSGSFTVVTKDGTTSCTLTNGAGSCTGPGGNVTFS